MSWREPATRRELFCGRPSALKTGARSGSRSSRRTATRGNAGEGARPEVAEGVKVTPLTRRVRARAGKARTARTIGEVQLHTVTRTIGETGTRTRGSPLELDVSNIR